MWSVAKTESSKRSRTEGLGVPGAGPGPPCASAAPFTLLRSTIYRVCLADFLGEGGLSRKESSGSLGGPIWVNPMEEGMLSALSEVPIEPKPSIAKAEQATRDTTVARELGRSAGRRAGGGGSPILSPPSMPSMAVLSTPACATLKPSMYDASSGVGRELSCRCTYPQTSEHPRCQCRVPEGAKHGPSWRFARGPSSPGASPSSAAAPPPRRSVAHGRAPTHAAPPPAARAR